MTTDTVWMRCAELLAVDLRAARLWRLATIAVMERAAPTSLELREIHVALKVVMDTRLLRPELMRIQTLEEIFSLRAMCGAQWATEVPPMDGWHPGYQPGQLPARPASAPRLGVIGSMPQGRPGGRGRRGYRGDVAWRKLVMALEKGHDGASLDELAEVLNISYNKRGSRRLRVLDLVQQARRCGCEIELKGGGEARTVHLVVAGDVGGAG